MFSTNIYKKFALPLSEPTSTSLIVSSILQVLCSVVSITGNILVLIVYYNNSQRSLRSKVSSMFIINLAVSDLIVGLVLLPLMILTNIFILCDLVLFLRAVLESILVPFLSSVSIWTVLGSSVDRFVAIRYPHSYLSVVTQRRVTIAILFSWLYSSTWIWFPFLPGVVGKYLLLFRSFVGFVVIMVVIFCWLAVYLKLRRVRRVDLAGDGGTTTRPNLQMWYSVERKVAKTLFCVTVILYGCFVPLWLRAIGHFFGTLDDYVFEIFAITLNLSNAAINPIIYSFTSRVFRSELLGKNT